MVGYGGMVRNTIQELVSKGFKGPIACTSTLTEPNWQPPDTRADGQIFTVMPRTTDTPLQGDDKNVVFFFAKKTLYRILELTATDPDPKNFGNNWMKEDHQTELDEFLLANGDTIVELEVVGASDWR